MKRIVITSISIAVAFLLFSPSGSHAFGGGLEMSPSVRFVMARPGSQIELPYQIANHADDSYLSCQIEAITYNSKKNTIQLAPLEKGDRAMQVETDTDCTSPSLVLSNDVLQGKLKIKIPEHVVYGEHILLFTYTQDPQQHFTTQTAISIRNTASIQIIINVSKNSSNKSTVKLTALKLNPSIDFAVGKSRLYLSDSMRPLTIRSLFENAGHQTTTTSMTLTRKNPSGTISTLFKTDMPVILLPGMKHEISNTLPPIYIPRSFTLSTILIPFHSEPIQMSIHVVQFPFIATGAALVILVILFYILSIRLK